MEKTWVKTFGHTILTFKTSYKIVSEINISIEQLRRAVSGVPPTTLRRVIVRGHCKKVLVSSVKMAILSFLTQDGIIVIHLRSYKW